MGAVWIRSFEAFLIIRTLLIVYFSIDHFFILFLFSFFVLSFSDNSIMITYCIQYTFKLSLIFLPIPWQWHCLCCINRPMLIMNEINKEAFNVHNITAFSIKKGAPLPCHLWFYFLSFICRYIVFQTGTLESFRYRCLFFLHNPLTSFFSVCVDAKWGRTSSSVKTMARRSYQQRRR